MVGSSGGGQVNPLHSLNCLLQNNLPQTSCTHILVFLLFRFLKGMNPPPLPLGPGRFLHLSLIISRISAYKSNHSGKEEVSGPQSWPDFQL